MMDSPSQCYSAWRAAGATAVGRSHELKGLPCQDRTYAHHRPSFSAITLADGAGSCALSHEGADTVTRSTALYLSRHMKHLLELSGEASASAVHRHIMGKLTAKARDLNAAPRDLSSTLLFAAALRDRIMAGHIGDGVIGCLKGEELQVISEPESGEYINYTVFTTSPGACSHFRLYKGHSADMKGFFLMSDGAAESLYDRKGKVFSRTLRQMMQWLDEAPQKEVEEALASTLSDVLRKRTGDDVSLILLKKSSFTGARLSVFPQPFIEELLRASGHPDGFCRRHALILKAWSEGMHRSRDISGHCEIPVRTVQNHLSYAKWRGLE